MTPGSFKFDEKTIPGAVLILLGLLFLLPTIGFLGVFARLIAAALFGGLAYYAFESGRRRANLLIQLAALPLAAIALSLLLPGSWVNGLFLAVLGLVFAYVWRSDPDRWWAVIPAGLLGTLAVTSALPRAASSVSGTLFLLGAAATFYALTRLRVKPQPWAVYPAAALAVLAVIALLDGRGGGWIAPLALIALGLYWLFREQVTRGG